MHLFFLLTVSNKIIKQNQQNRYPSITNQKAHKRGNLHSKIMGLMFRRVFSDYNLKSDPVKRFALALSIL